MALGGTVGAVAHLFLGWDEMTITRAQMEKQVKHGKKKPVTNAKMGKFLETVSPAYSIMKGKGPIGEAFGKAGKMGLGGIAGMIAAGQMGNKPKGSDAMKATACRKSKDVWWRCRQDQA